jgi:hypothetical protein
MRAVKRADAKLDNTDRLRATIITAAVDVRR